MLATRKGLTLPELLVGLVLSLLATLIAFQLFNLFWRVGADIATKAQLQQMASVAMERIALDGRPSAIPGVTVGDGVLAFVRLADLEPNGLQRWEQTVVIYQKRGPLMLRREVQEPSLPPHLPSRLSADLLKTIVQQSGGTCLSDCLDSFQARFTGSEGSAQTLLVTFGMSRLLRSGRRCQLELSRDFYMRNAP